MVFSARGTVTSFRTSPEKSPIWYLKCTKHGKRSVKTTLHFSNDLKLSETGDERDESPYTQQPFYQVSDTKHSFIYIVYVTTEIILKQLYKKSNIHTPFLKHFQRQMQQLSFALFSFLYHLQDANGSAELSPKLQHLLIRHLVILTILQREKGTDRWYELRNMYQKIHLKICIGHPRII